ncbi:hypothetical protein PIB30_077138 [Stylosanthes scabra]|uniref:Uncharacterized protein n=1 Tax=Stylosanthes scabra TaxID=79078 RepID=A0ABU6VQK1_9FABA|nr:hypothetical protein [Stylosanthes scabra]
MSEDSHVWMTFEVHKRVMEDKVMEFYAEVRHTGCSSSFRPFVRPTITAPSMLLALEDVAKRDYNSGDDLDYEDESSYASMEEDDEVSNTPMVGGPRLILPAPLPIPDLANVPSYFQQLDIDERHVEDPTLESVAVEYNKDGGAEFMVGHRMRNRDIVLMAVKNYSIRRNAEYRVIESDRLNYMQASHSRVSMDDSSGSLTKSGILGGLKDRCAAHLFSPRHARRSFSARQHSDQIWTDSLQEMSLLPADLGGYYRRN